VRVLFASTHGAGHFGPLVPFLDACLRNGHEVLVVGPPTLDPRGYPFRVGASPPEEELRSVWDGLPSQPSGQAEVVVVGTVFAGLNVRAMLQPFEDAIAQWQPDLRPPRAERVQRFRDPAAEAVPEPLPDWWPGDERPLVYLSFGSVAASLPPAAVAYRKALQAVAEVPVRVLLSGAGDLDLGPVPSNVHVERWVPQADVLAHASAVVCHGGSGTTLGALGAGFHSSSSRSSPTIRVAMVGAGVVVSLDAIRPGIERVLADDRHSRVARALAEEMRNLPPADEFLRAYALDPA
jgi:UDP:flavonoid glycosyltransferase YjiC (YdhE family)